jgi:hypothetical protein
MDKIVKALKTILVAAIIFFGLILIYGFFSKFTGIAAIVSNLFGIFWNSILFFVFILILAILGITSISALSKRVLYLSAVGVAACIFVVWQSPQENITRFQEEVQNHKMLNNLKPTDVSFIVVDNVFFTEAEQISPIVAALNASTWFAPRKGECMGKEAQMSIGFHTGQVVRLHISHLCNEDAVALLFIKPLPSGFASGGNAYVPKLPSTLEGLGYPLSMDY